LGIPRKEAADIIENYFAQYPGIKQYMADTMNFARENGYVTTLMGAAVTCAISTRPTKPYAVLPNEMLSTHLYKVRLRI
jgi:DNA polymerase I-like protein with 3'-5' exonuclease and polymerase domains